MKEEEGQWVKENERHFKDQEEEDARGECKSDGLIEKMHTTYSGLSNAAEGSR